MNEPESRSGLGSRLANSGAGIAVAMVVMNLATYGYQIFASTKLGPGAYGAVASLLNVLMLVQVVALGLQTTAARRISAEPQHTDQIERAILRVSWRAAAAFGGVLLALTPVINGVLRLDSLTTAALVGVAAVPITLMGAQIGILQGERRWFALALVYVAAGVPRFVIGTALLMTRPSEFLAFLAVVIGSMFPVLIGSIALRGHTRIGSDSHSHDHRGRALLSESLKNSQALFAFFALSNIDLIVARNVLPAHDNGLYAGGVILAKAALFLPQFVVVVAFPAMSTAHERRRALTRSLLSVAALGAATTLGAWLLAPIALFFVGGPKYTEIQGHLWLFAILGTLMSMLQLLVYAVLARQGQRSSYLVWLALALLIAGGLRAAHWQSLLNWVLLVDTALLVVLIAISYYVVKDPAPPEDDAAETAWT